MLKKILFGVLILAALIAGVCGYFYLKNIKKPKISATQAIPADCSFLIESDDFPKLFKTLNESSLIWDELQQVNAVSDLNASAALADSLIRTNPKITEVFTGNKVYIAVYPSAENKSEFLYALNLPEINYTDEVISFLKTQALNYEVMDLPGSSLKVTKVLFKSPKASFYCLVNAGLVLLSQNKDLIERAISLQDKSSLNLDSDFMKLEESAGKGNDLRLFVNHKRIASLAGLLDQKQVNAPVFQPSPGKGWTELDIDLSTNEVLLNGFTLADSSVFLSALKHQRAQEIECISFMPASTSSFLFFGMEDYARFSKDLSALGIKDEAIEIYSPRIDVDLDIAIQQLAGNELCLFRTTDKDTFNTYGLLRVNDREDASKFLKSVADTAIYIGKADSLYQFTGRGIFNTVSLGLCPVSLPYCTLTDEYLVFADNKEGIQRYFYAMEQNKTLKLNEKFMHFAENNLGSEINFYAYTSFAGSEDYLINYAGGELKKILEDRKSLFSKFDAAAYQLVNYKGGLLNQAYLLYSPASKQVHTSVWETQLDTISSTAPQILLNHKTGGREVLMQDGAGKIYLISNTGKIQWKKQLNEKVMGVVHQVDYFKNEKLQMLFNTASQIHLIDRNGNYVQGYPIDLPSPATAELAVFDYEKNKDYRILVPCENKKLLNYNINGKLTEGFGFPEAQEVINLPVQWLRINQKDYLLAADKAGNVYVTGRRGETRISLKNKIAPGCNSWFIDTGKDLTKTYIHFVNTAERTLQRLSLGDVSDKYAIDCGFEIKEASFAFINDDGLVDVIVSDETGFKAFDDLGKALLEYTSRENIDPHVSFQVLNDQPLFFVTEIESGKCVPVNLSGMEEQLNLPSGKTPPVIASFADGAEKFLLMTSGSLLYCFGLN